MAESVIMVCQGHYSKVGVWYGTVVYGRLCMVVYGSVWYCMARYGSVRDSSVWFGSAWYGMVR